MMFPNYQSRLVFLMIYALSLLTFVRALSIPKYSLQESTLWAPQSFHALVDRDTSACGAHTSCMRLNTTSDVVATLCCPAGQDCNSIAPISCDEGLQNATSNPTSPLHVSPPAQLQTCGKACCPMGYNCLGGTCFLSSASRSQGSSSTSALSSTTTLSSTNAASIPTSSSTSTTTASSGNSSSPAGSEASSDATHITPSNGFSGKSFAAGFIPGIAIGAILVFAGVFIVSRRQRNNSASYLDHQHDPTRDTLTDLGPDLSYRPTMHGRSISGPVADPNLGYRTDFLKSTPPREFLHDNQAGTVGYKVEVSAPASENPSSVPQTQERLPKVKALFSRSPFLNQAQTPVPTQAPLPDFLKRGTVSYQITPVRGLKKQRSMHSLRRQVTNATARSNSSGRQPQSLSRNDSTETIQVLMQTPDHEPCHPAPRPPLHSQREHRHSSTSWESTESGDTTPIDSGPVARYPPRSVPTLHQTMNSTPTRQGREGTGDVGASLGTPYTPSNYNRRDVRDAGQSNTSGGLTVQREPMKRDTTFSSMMERAGFTKEDLLMSGGAGQSEKVSRKH